MAVEQLKTQKTDKPKRASAFKNLLLASSFVAALAFSGSMLARDGATLDSCRALSKKVKEQHTLCHRGNDVACAKNGELLNELISKCSDVNYQENTPPKNEPVEPVPGNSRPGPSKRIRY